MNRRLKKPPSDVSVSGPGTTAWGRIHPFLLTALLLFTATAAYAQKVITRTDSIPVNSLVYEGNGTFSSSALDEVVLTKESPGSFWVWIYDNISEGLGSEETFFDYPTFEEDAKAIKQFYKNNGFLYTKVNKEVSFTDDSLRVNVAFNIVEGNPSHIDSINYRNIENLAPEVREEIYSNQIIEVGDRYSEAKVAEEVKRILSLLRDSGYPRAHADSTTVELRLSSNNVTVKMPFTYGRRLYVGSIKDSIVGEDELNLAHKVIYDRLEFKSGDVFSVTKQRNSESNLLRYNIFSNVESRAEVPQLENTQDTLVPVTLILKPRNKWDLSITPLPLLQLRDNRLFVGPEGSILWRNVFGGAQIMEVNASYLGSAVDFSGDLPFWGAQELQGQLRFDQPYFIDNYTNLGATMSFTYAIEKEFYEGNFYQFVPNVRRILSDNIIWSSELSLESLIFTIDPSVAGGDSSLVEQRSPFFNFQELNYINAILTTSLDLNYTNSLVNPSAGWALRPTLEEAGFFGAFDALVPSDKTTTEYHKVELFFRTYTDLSRNRTTILAWKLKGGSIFRYGASAKSVDPVPVPLTRRYYGGGANSVRGWYPRQLAADEDNVNVGSHVLLETSVEVRWQLFPNTTNWILPLDKFWLTMFADAGNVWNDLEAVTIPQTGLAAGAGFAFLTSFGPFRVEYGYQMYNPALGDIAWYDQRPFVMFKYGAIQFGFGWAF